MGSESKYLHLSLFISAFLSPTWWEQSTAQAAWRWSPGAAGCWGGGVTPGFGPGTLESCGAKTVVGVDVPGFERVPVRMFRGGQEGKDIRPILIMTFGALPNYIVSLKTVTQIFMSGTFYSHYNQ